MGRLSAEDMAVLESIDVVLYWHFTSNHYPPLPVSLIEPAKEAIRLAGEGLWEEEVELPEGITWRGKSTAPVEACVGDWHLESFLKWR